MNDGQVTDSATSGQTMTKDPDLKAFVGTKILLAKPMTNAEWVKGKNQETTGEDGYLVIYDNGYRAWSPKDVFETHYRLLTDTEKSVARF